MTDIKFDSNYINEIKKKIINYISRSNANINKIKYNLSLFSKFVIENSKQITVKCNNPSFKDGKCTPAKIIISSAFFEVNNGSYYINPEYEDILSYKLTYQLIKGCSSNIIYEDNKPVDLLFDPYDEGYRVSLAKCISEDINDYIVPDNIEKYHFTKKIARMLTAIIGERYTLNSFFRQDESFNMMIYSLSTKTELFKELNKLMILINRLINTLDSDAIKKHDKIIEETLNLYQHRLINLIICELYIPYINSVGLDNRKAVRDAILRGFLGNDYINEKLTNDNKDSYYWASLVNNTVAINNKISEDEIRTLKDNINKEDSNHLHDIYVLEKNDKTKNDVKEFFVFEERNKIIIKNQNKRNITEPHLVEEILSYAFINCNEKSEVKRVEQGIMMVCEKGKRFKCSLKGNPLSNKMLVAGVKQLARKNGYNLVQIGSTNDDYVEFDIEKK